ncbi:high affinity immunoglobulin gamma Fc receptor I-like [Engraulis encrasicolus]|uniref:high affinity immunoglobulin gamma Fc receptor I-like n=1 Tax=Engraulis encrasicolus TaxID=184585 RepID=UPI002FD3CEFC
MHLPVCLLVFSLFQSWANAHNHRKAVVQVAEGRPHLLSGGFLRLVCHVPQDADPDSPWMFEWFYNGRSVSLSTTYTFWEARVLQSGNYTCTGSRESVLDRTGILRTQISDPLWVEIDGGWVILKAPSKPMIMEESMDLTCHIRGNRSPQEVVFYLDGREVGRQGRSTLTVHNLTSEDAGQYSCKATWEEKGFYHSSVSTGVPVSILEILETPLLLAELHLVRRKMNLQLTCRTQLNTREETSTPILHYFMKNGRLLGPASSQNAFTIRDVSKGDSARYSCSVAVPALGERKGSYEVEVAVPWKR